MDAEGRPAKMRKLQHGLEDVQTASNDGIANGVTNDQSPSHAQNEISVSPKPLASAHISQNVETVPAAAQSSTTGTLDASSNHLPVDVAPLLSTHPADTADPPMSKSQMKKQRRKDEWEAQRGDRKLKRKEKAVQKRERKKTAKEEAIANGEPLPDEKKARRVNPVQLPITIVLDCDFDDLMRDGERISLGSQVTRSYSDNKNAPFRAHLAVASFGGKLKERFDGLLAKHYESWKGVHFLEGDFVEAAAQAEEWMKGAHGGKLVGPVFGRYAESDETKAQAREQGEVIYLSSDSDYTLTELKPYSTYIIGGLVDKNREKGICHKRALEKGVKTARLPIGEFLDMASRKVLATNHVNEIMLRWLEMGDWGEAFMKVIPKRKGGQLKGQAAEGGEEEDSENPGTEAPGDGGEDTTTQDGNGEVAANTATAVEAVVVPESAG